MIKIGMLIADRYEVLEKVGTGGMSDVYKAKDHRLNRMVAVKVLKQEFSENATFVSKFRVEAQAAAGLMHPNIVNVYDVGEEKGTYYIIMELVNGITLKRYIEKKTRLTPREAVTVAIQVSMGLAAAHRGHIIHRDIKPQNIIISKEGKVKVTDFGIAKASTSNTITSNVMGSVHYTSPEQARGGFSDEKSDVYSLGVTLYEMVTGKVPYDGETTVAIALQHIQDPFPSPKEVVPDLPYSVEQIILKCCEKSPDRRYQTMDELATDLRHSLSDPDGDFVLRMGDENLSETRPMTAKEREEIRRKTNAAAAGGAAAGAAAGINAASAAAGTAMAGAAGSPAEYSNAAGRPGEGGAYETYVNGNGRPAGDNGSADHDLYPDEEGDDDALAEDERRLDKIIQILSVVAVVVIGVVIILVAVNRHSASNNESADKAQQQTQDTVQETEESKEDEEEQAEEINTVVMPGVIGSTLEDAQEALKRVNLTWEIVYGTSDEYEDDVVMDASAKEGDELEEGTKVTLTVVKTEKVIVTNVIGKKQADAEEELKKQGLQTQIEEIYSEETEAGIVEKQDPGEGEEVSAGTSVTLYVSQGPDRTGQVQVPNILGMTEQEASAELLKVGLKPGESTVTDRSGRYDPGIVVGQSIEKDTFVAEGTAVDMDLSGDPRYSYSARIEAPRYSEDPDYKEGTPVTLVIKTADNKELLNTTTSKFPYDVSFTNLPYSGATLYLYYTNIITEAAPTGETEEEEFDEDGEDGDQTSQRGVSMELTRELVFTRE